MWDEKALKRLAAIWVASKDRRSITKTVDSLEKALRIEPHRVGESRGDAAIRMAVVNRLGIQFEILDDDATVRVYGVFDLNAPS